MSPFKAVGVVCLAVSALGCASAPSPAPTTPSRAPSESNSAPLQYGGGDGLSCATRVVVHAADEGQGVAAEYAWLAERYPGNERGRQSLSKCDGKPADILEITTADGRSLEIYFDISEFYGHF
jgi:hypothetical protein